MSSQKRIKRYVVYYNSIFSFAPPLIILQAGQIDQALATTSFGIQQWPESPSLYKLHARLLQTPSLKRKRTKEQEEEALSFLEIGACLSGGIACVYSKTLNHLFC